MRRALSGDDSCNALGKPASSTGTASEIRFTQRWQDHFLLATASRSSAPVQLATTIETAVLIGSLREGSFSRQLAMQLMHLAPAPLSCREIPIRELALYDPDADTDAPPQAWSRFRSAVATAQAVLIITPEYNRSMPAALKNALDVGSRPKADSVWTGKPAAVVTVSAGLLGGFGANHHVRQVLVSLGMPTLAQPEAYIGGAAGLFDAQGEFSSASTRVFFAGFMSAFARFADAMASDRRSVNTRDRASA